MSGREASSDGTAPGGGPLVLTPDQRLRVFVSSTLEELAPERAAVREAIQLLRLAPIMFELGARPHPPRVLYRAYLDQSHVFIGIYWQSYGWVAPGETTSGLEDEYRQSGTKPRLIYVKRPAPHREPRLQELLQRIEGDDTVSYTSFSSADELRTLVEDDLAVLLTERFEQRTAAAAEREAERRLRGRLPAPATPLVGRRAELAELRRLFAHEGARLVTLTGPAGVGKSRLAQQAAEELADDFVDGAAFVPLAPLAEARLVPAAIANALGVADDADRPLHEALAEHLSKQRLLLFLDNFEHVDEAAAFLSELLSAAAGLSCIVTSRTPLRLYGEFEFHVLPLKLEEEAIPLFRARARAVGATFVDADTDLLAAVCRRLDCLPLAIELVAARTRDLSQDELASLASPLDLASGGPRDTPPRQQALRAAIEWSHELLSTDEQALFRRLSVFAGGCTAAAAHAVVASTQQELSSLVAHSLLVPQPGAGERRFQMLETIRAYARERLERSGEAARVAPRHAEYFLGFAEQAEQEMRDGADRGTWLDRLAADHDNVRAALAWAHDAGPPALELRLAAALRFFWELRGHLGEGRAALTAALARRGDQPPETRAKALNAAAVMAYRQGDLDEAGRLIDEFLELYRELGDATGVARALGELGNIASARRDHGKAIELYEQSASMLRALGHHLGLATILANIGDIEFKEANYDRATRLLEEAMELQRGSATSTASPRRCSRSGVSCSVRAGWRSRPASSARAWTSPPRSATRSASATAWPVSATSRWRTDSRSRRRGCSAPPKRPSSAPAPRCSRPSARRSTPLPLRPRSSSARRPSPPAGPTVAGSISRTPSRRRVR